MDYKEAKNILGNRPLWELKKMKRALSSLELLNTDEENKRLEAVKVLIEYKQKLFLGTMGLNND